MAGDGIIWSFTKAVLNAFPWTIISESKLNKIHDAIHVTNRENGTYPWLCTLQWRNYWRDGVSNYQPHNCLLNRLFRRRSKQTSKLRVTGLCEGNSPVTGEFPAQRASYAENVSIWWRHHDKQSYIFTRNTSTICNALYWYLFSSHLVLFL